MPTSDRESVAQTAALLSSRAVLANLPQGTHVAARDAEELHRIATKLHRWAERRCNEDLTCQECEGTGDKPGVMRRTDKPIPKCTACAGSGDTLGRREQNAEKRAREIATPYGLRVYFQGDCRGAALYLIPEEKVPADPSVFPHLVYDQDTANPPSVETMRQRWADSYYNSFGTAVCHLGR